MCRNIANNEHAHFVYAQKSTAVRFLSMLPAVRVERGVLLARLNRLYICIATKMLIFFNSVDRDTCFFFRPSQLELWQRTYQNVEYRNFLLALKQHVCTIVCFHHTYLEYAEKNMLNKSNYLNLLFLNTLFLSMLMSTHAFLSMCNRNYLSIAIYIFFFDSV